MLLNNFRNITSLPLWSHAAAAAATIFGFQFAKGRLDASYAAAKHPVDYMTGQTTFSGPAIKGFYAQMQETGTLEVYATTQLIDFGFILAMACIGIFVCTLIARISRDGSFGRRIGLWAGLSFVAGAICDAIENGWSFIMLANPAGFANWLALPYSGFASVKFGLISLGLLLALISLGLAVVGRLFKRPVVA